MELQLDGFLHGIGIQPSTNRTVDFRPDAETVSALLALRGLRIDEPNAQGRTALSLAVEGGEFGDRVNEAIVGLLLSRGADPSIADCEGRAPLDWANGVAVGMLKGTT